MAAGKRRRAHKVSNGINGGGGKVRLSEMEKALMGKGVFDRLDMVSTDRWARKHPKTA